VCESKLTARCADVFGSWGHWLDAVLAETVFSIKSDSITSGKRTSGNIRQMRRRHLGIYTTIQKIDLKKKNHCIQQGIIQLIKSDNKLWKLVSTTE